MKSKDVAKRTDRSGDLRSLKPHVLDRREEVQAVSLAVSRRRMMVTRHVSVTYRFTDWLAALRRGKMWSPRVDGAET
jgi:hypothetical protein